MKEKKVAYVSLYAGRVNINMYPTTICLTVEAFFSRLVGRKHIEVKGEQACLFSVDNVEYWSYCKGSDEIINSVDYFARRNPDAFRHIILTMIAELTCDFRPTDARVSYTGIVPESVEQPATSPA